MADAVTAGIQTEMIFCFPKRNEPTNEPAVTPKRMKNTDMSVADNGETSREPSLQNAVKQARIQSPRKEEEHPACRIRDFVRLVSPVVTA